MKQTLRYACALVVAPLLLTACGGGSAATVPTGSAGGPRAASSIVFSVVIPNQTVAGASRSSQYISSNTHSMSVSVNGGAAQVFGLTPSTNGNCTTTAGATTCSNLSVAAAPGTDSLTFDMYQDSTPLPSSPTLLATTTVNNEVVQQGVANQLGVFTLNPVLGSIAMSISAPSGGFSPGTPSSGNAINITAKDPSGATILAPGNYDNAGGTAAPIGLASTQSAFTFAIDGGTAAATGSLASPSDSATLSYSGASVSSTTTISATSGSLTASQTISSLLAPITATLTSSASGTQYHIVSAPPELDFYTTGITGTVALSESGYSGQFTLQSDTCNTTDDASATGNYATFSPGLSSSATSFTVTAAAAGTSAHPAICTATFGDTNGQTLSLTFSVTTVSFGLQ